MSGGVVAERVAANVRALRTRRGLSTYALSRLLGELGQPVHPGSITRLEACERQVSVDDLVALAVVLGCSPNRLLLPADPGPDECAVGELHTDGADLWAWACGDRPLPGEPDGDSPVAAAVWAIENAPAHRKGRTVNDATRLKFTAKAIEAAGKLHRNPAVEGRASGYEHTLADAIYDSLTAAERHDVAELLIHDGIRGVFLTDLLDEREQESRDAVLKAAADLAAVAVRQGFGPSAIHLRMAIAEYICDERDVIELGGGT